ncbi:MAG TPA: hypothetical protein VHV54_14045, partial [Candidatus Binatia bacterium]|nr:hypothetical protein [Candidatus Binatia bacterium]
QVREPNFDVAPEHLTMLDRGHAVKPRQTHWFDDGFAFRGLHSTARNIFGITPALANRVSVHVGHDGVDVDG